MKCVCESTKPCEALLGVSRNSQLLPACVEVSADVVNKPVKEQGLELW